MYLILIGHLFASLAKIALLFSSLFLSSSSLFCRANPKLESSSDPVQQNKWTTQALHERRTAGPFAEHFQQSPRQNDICYQITLLVSYGLQIDFVDQFPFIVMCSANISILCRCVVAAVLTTRLSLHHAQFPAFQALKSYEVRTVVHQSV